MLIYISLGSNLSNGESMILDALEWLRSHSSQLQSSEVYTTRPVSGIGRDYFNAVASMESSTNLSTFQSLTKEYEVSRGRTPEARSAGIVPIDLDIVMADGIVIRNGDFNQPYFQIGYQKLINS